MPSKSDKQRRFMAAAANNPEFARKAGVPVTVAKEFHATDKRRYAGGGIVGALQRAMMLRRDPRMVRRGTGQGQASVMPGRQMLSNPPSRPQMHPGQAAAAGQLASKGLGGPPVHGITPGSRPNPALATARGQMGALNQHAQRLAMRGKPMFAGGGKVDQMNRLLERLSLGRDRTADERARFEQEMEQKLLENRFQEMTPTELKQELERLMAQMRKPDQLLRPPR